MSDWHVNEGLAPLVAEAEGAYPGIVVGTIGDAAHRHEVSDHNPNAAGRVNAADLMLGPAFTEAQAQALIPFLIADHRTKYLIHDRRIWRSPQGHTAAEAGWHDYDGDDPHTNHIHESVWDSAHTDPSAWILEDDMASPEEYARAVWDATELDPLSTTKPQGTGRTGGWLRMMEKRRSDMQADLEGKIAALDAKLDTILAALKP